MLVVTSSPSMIDALGAAAVPMRSIADVRSHLAGSPGPQTVVLGPEVPADEAVTTRAIDHGFAVVSSCMLAPLGGRG